MLAAILMRMLHKSTKNLVQLRHITLSVLFHYGRRLVNDKSNEKLPINVSIQLLFQHKVHHQKVFLFSIIISKGELHYISLRVLSDNEQTNSYSRFSFRQVYLELKVKNGV